MGSNYTPPMVEASVYQQHDATTDPAALDSPSSELIKQPVYENKNLDAADFSRTACATVAEPIQNLVPEHNPTAPVTYDWSIIDELIYQCSNDNTEEKVTLKDSNMTTVTGTIMDACIDNPGDQITVTDSIVTNVTRTVMEACIDNSKKQVIVTAPVMTTNTTSVDTTSKDNSEEQVVMTTPVMTTNTTSVDTTNKDNSEEQVVVTAPVMTTNTMSVDTTSKDNSEEQVVMTAAVMTNVTSSVDTTSEACTKTSLEAANDQEVSQKSSLQSYDNKVDDDNYSNQLKIKMVANDINGATEVFKKWIDAKNRQHASKVVVSKTRCPICNEERLDLKKHLISQHNFDYGRAVGLKSQLNVYKGKSRLPSVLRKSKPRFYEKKLCPVNGCHKVVARIENHLKQTHKIKDKVKYKKLLSQAIPESSVNPVADDGLMTDDTSDEEEIAYKDFRKFVRSNPSEIVHIEARKNNADSEEDPYNDKDPDWYVKELTDMAKYKEKRKRKLHIEASSTVSKRLNMESRKVDQCGNSNLPDSTFTNKKEECPSIPEEFNQEEVNQETHENDLEFDNTKILPDENTGLVIDNNKINAETVDDHSDVSEDDEDELIDFMMTPNSIDSLMEQFKHWLMSVDGRFKNERSAQQCCRQVLSTLKMISPGEFNTTELFTRESLRDHWLTFFDKMRLPGTIRTYLNSLKRFYEFVLCDNPKSVYASSQECHRMMTCVQNWSSTYKKKINIRKFEKQAEDLACLLTEKELHEYDHSELVEECRDNLKRFRISSKAPNLKIFASCRDYLISSLILSNASRPGAIKNMTLKEFKTCKISQNNTHLVSVKDHKTASTAGHRIVVFTQALYEECQAYVAIRNMLPGIGISSSDPVFVSWAGRPMSSSLVGDQFSAFFQRATNCNLAEKQSRRLTATLVRKSFVSKVHGEIPELKRDLANMMCHSEATASKSYFLQEKAKNVSETFVKINETMRCGGEEKLKERFCKEIMSGDTITLDAVRERISPGEFPSMTESQIRDKVRYLQRNSVSQTYSLRRNAIESLKTDRIENVDENVDCNVFPPSESESVTEDEGSSLFHRRVRFLPSEEKLIRRWFKKFIENPNSLVKKDAISKILQKDVELQNILKKYGLHRILIKIRTERSKKNSRD